MAPYLEPWKRYSDGTYRKLGSGTVVDPPGDFPNHPAITGQQFHDAWGTRVFPTYSAKTGGQLLTTGGRAWLTNMKPGFITHKIAPGQDPDIQTWALGIYNTHGIKTMLTVGEPHETYTSTQWNNMIDAIQSMGNAVDMVCGQNEINHVRNNAYPLPSNWKEIARDHQQQLWNRIQTLNATRAGLGQNPIKVGNCNLWSGNLTLHNTDGAAFFPMIKNYCDTITWHLYPRGDNPDWNLDTWKTFYRTYLDSVSSPTKPIICTEAGYFVAYNYTGGAIAVSEWAHAIYLKKMWLEYALRGFRVSQFEFLNDPDSSDSNREANFGSVETPGVNQSTWGKNASYDQLAEWCAFPTAGSGTTYPVDVQTGQSGVQTLVVKTGAASAKLFAWRRVKLENSDTSGPASLSPANISLTVSSAAGVQNRNISHDVVVLDI